MIQSFDSDPLLQLPKHTFLGMDFRDRLRRQTTQHIRRRLWLRRGYMICGLIFCFLIGTQWPGRSQAIVKEQTILIYDPKTKIDPSTMTYPEQTSAEELELQAERNFTRSESGQLFKQAGDRYLKESNIQAAMRCYRNFLDESDENYLELDESDSWLLVSLKSSRAKETNDAKQN